MQVVQVKVEKTHIDAVIPQYATTGSACFDLVAVEDIVIAPKETVIVRTGLKMEVPLGYKIAIYPRSGISLKTNLRMANSVGQIDSDYRGEIGVILTNTATAGYFDVPSPFIADLSGGEMFSTTDTYQSGTLFIKKGDRIAQAAIEPVIVARFIETSLSETARGEGGFGSTGTKVKMIKEE